MTGRTWFVRQVRGRRRWTTRTSPPGANVAWTLLAEDERVMTAGDAIVYIVDDDAPLCESLMNLLRSMGLRVAAFASAQEFLRSPRPDGPSCLVLDVRLPGLSGPGFSANNARVHVPRKARQSLAGVGLQGDAKDRSGR